MGTYSDQDFSRIAEVTGKSAAHVRRLVNRFEAAAVWYRLYCRAPKGLHLTGTSKDLGRIASAAQKLLRQLLNHLASAENNDEDSVVQATKSIGRLAEIFDAIDAAQELERRGRKAAVGAKQLSRLISIKGPRRNYALNVWLAEMMSIYKALTGKPARISVVSSGPNRKKPGAVGRGACLAYGRKRSAHL